MNIPGFGSQPPEAQPPVVYKFPKGAYIKDDNGVEYFLLASEAEQWEDNANDESMTNEQFWEWWGTFKSAHGLKPRSLAWAAAPRTGGGLSSWWQYDLHSAFGSTSQMSTRLALALSAVANTVRIVDDSDPPFAVMWATDTGDTSSTDFEAKRISINAKPIKSPGVLSNADAIDITTGFGLHEASHAKYTSKVANEVRKPEMLEPVSVAMFLANVIEDLRIEWLTSKEYPGFKPYFDRALVYMWGEVEGHLRDHAAKGKPFAKTWGGGELRDCLNAIVMRIKWPAESVKYLGDPTYQAEMPWWDAWNERYQSGETTLRAAVIEGLDRLRSTNEKMEQEMETLSQAGRDGNTNGEFPTDLLPTCTNDHADKDNIISNAESEEVRKLSEERFREWKPTEHPDVPMRPVFVRHPMLPKELAEPQRMTGLGDRLKAVLRFRPELPRYSERLLKSGELDEEQLFRFSMGDDRMFEKQVIETYPNAQVSLLVDMSGSMQGGIPSGGGAIISGKTAGKYYEYTRLDLVQALARLFVNALSGMEGVQPKVFGHTADTNYREHSAEVYELWEPGESDSRLGLINCLEHCNNLDGYAIEYCVKDLLDRGGPTDQRLLIVLADGQPSADGYGGSTAMAHVRAVTDKAEKQGVFVLQIAIADSLDTRAQERMFKNWVHFKSYDELPMQLTKVLANFLNR